MHDRLFEAALGIAPPWFVAGVRFDEARKVLTLGIDFTAGTRFAVEDVPGEHPVHDTITKTYRHLNFFQHECVLEVRTPRVKLPNGTVHLVKPPFAGKLSGFTLLFEALVLMLAPQMPFAAVARIVGISPHRVLAICNRYVSLAVAQAYFGNVRALAIDETSSQYLLSLDVADRPGVLHAVTGVFARHEVSIRAAEQEGNGPDARLAFVTHVAKESAVQATVRELRELDVVRNIGGLLRVIG